MLSSLPILLNLSHLARAEKRVRFLFSSLNRTLELLRLITFANKQLSPYLSLHFPLLLTLSIYVLSHCSFCRDRSNKTTTSSIHF